MTERLLEIFTDEMGKAMKIMIWYDEDGEDDDDHDHDHNHDHDDDDDHDHDHDDHDDEGDDERFVIHRWVRHWHPRIKTYA